MLSILLESKPRKQRSPGTTLFSVVLHSVLIFFAIYATARAGIPKDNEQREQKVNFVEVKPAEPPPPVEKKPEPPPPPKPPKPSEHRPAPLPPVPTVIAPPVGFKVLEAPVNIPTEIPTVDLSAKVTNEADFSGKGAAGGSSTGVAGAGAGVDTNRNYAEFEVEQEVIAISGVLVAYPEELRTSGVEGEVLAQFVVNETGRVETSTFTVLKSSNPTFTKAVRDALPRMRFRAAKIGKTNVSQIVQQAFRFQLDR